jgi:hypothetical protein
MAFPFSDDQPTPRPEILARHRAAHEALLRRMVESQERLRRAREMLSERMARRGKRPPRPRKNGGGSEAVTVEPNRPRLGEGGAAAALEFDD